MRSVHSVLLDSTPAEITRCFIDGSLWWLLGLCGPAGPSLFSGSAPCIRLRLPAVDRLGPAGVHLGRYLGALQGRSLAPDLLFHLTASRGFHLTYSCVGAVAGASVLCGWSPR